MISLLLSQTPPVVSMTSTSKCSFNNDNDISVNSIIRNILLRIMWIILHVIWLC